MAASVASATCECCGRPTADGDAVVWFETCTARRLSVQARRGGRGSERPSANGLYFERTLLRSRRACPSCHRALAAGAPVYALDARRFRRHAVAVVLVVSATLVARPFLTAGAIVLHRGLIEAPPPAALFDRTFKPFLDRDPTLPRRPLADPGRW